jgi:hypothetical protein
VFLSQEGVDGRPETFGKGFLMDLKCRLSKRPVGPRTPTKGLTLQQMRMVSNEGLTGRTMPVRITDDGIYSLARRRDVDGAVEGVEARGVGVDGQGVQGERSAGGLVVPDGTPSRIFAGAPGGKEKECGIGARPAAPVSGTGKIGLFHLCTSISGRV